MVKTCAEEGRVCMQQQQLTCILSQLDTDMLHHKHQAGAQWLAMDAVLEWRQNNSR